MSQSHPLTLSPIVPVVRIDQLDHAIPLAQALLDGGIPIIEVTLRSDCALAAIELIADKLPEIRVGAGTINQVDQVDACINHGASFGLSPGASPSILEKASKLDFEFVPGVANATDMIVALEYGCRFQKFFPAEVAGGPKALKAYSGPFSEIQFCPTGGVNLKNLKDYLSLDNVVCVGGTWLTPASLMVNRDWHGITVLAKEALSSC